jgi:hypothetical protein
LRSEWGAAEEAASFFYPQDYQFVEILILILATYRIAHLLAEEAGPFDMFGWLREKAGVGFDDAGNLYGSNELARGLMCLWCNSVWVGLALAIGHYLIPDITFWLALPFALSGGAVLISEVVDG